MHRIRSIEGIMMKLINAKGEEFEINDDLMSWVLMGIDEAQDIAIDREERGEQDAIGAGKEIGKLIKFIYDERHPGIAWRE